MLRVTAPVRLLLSQVCLLSLATALPFVLVPAGSSSSVSKRAFDRVEEADFGLMRKRAFDRLDSFDFGLRKRAFDRLDGSEFGLMKRKRAFDRLDGGEFGLLKRAAPPEEDSEREDAISSLASSIRTLRRLRRADYRGGVDDVLYLPLDFQPLEP